MDNNNSPETVISRNHVEVPQQKNTTNEIQRLRDKLIYLENKMQNIALEDNTSSLEPETQPQAEPDSSWQGEPVFPQGHPKKYSKQHQKVQERQSQRANIAIGNTPSYLQSELKEKMQDSVYMQESHKKVKQTGVTKSVKLNVSQSRRKKDFQGAQTSPQHKKYQESYSKKAKNDGAGNSEGTNKKKRYMTTSRKKYFDCKQQQTVRTTSQVREGHQSNNHCYQQQQSAEKKKINNSKIKKDRINGYSAKPQRQKYNIQKELDKSMGPKASTESYRKVQESSEARIKYENSCRKSGRMKSSRKKMSYSQAKTADQKSRNRDWSGRSPSKVIKKDNPVTRQANTQGNNSQQIILEPGEDKKMAQKINELEKQNKRLRDKLKTLDTVKNKYNATKRTLQQSENLRKNQIAIICQLKKMIPKD